MATITEDYCPKEIYRLLLKNGFDGEIHTTFDKDGYTQASITIQMAMKWLREVYKILILVEYDCPVFSSDIYKMDDIDEYGSAKHISPTFANCKNYEQACEAAIKYCLENLI
jgi:hypothetical protein